MAQKKKAKVAVVHPRLGSGGSEARALWSLQVLRTDYDVSLITCGPVDLQRLNAFYGTALAPEDFRLLRVPLPPGVTAHRFNALQGHILQRYCQRVAPQFDVMISAYNPLNFGVRGIQFLADFCFAPNLRFLVDPVLQSHRSWWYGDTLIRRAYMGLCNLISRADREGFKNDLTIANSQWSATLFREHFGIDTRVLYPPVVDDTPLIPYEQRENGFVCVGSVIPEKRMDALIRILHGVRQRGHDVHLHILGGLDDSPFGRELERLAAAHGDWVRLEGRVGGEKKRELIARHRFGIHGRKNEPFGIAVAEMVKAGCIVFVPNGGGQTEIANHTNLIYQDDDDAVNKIDAVLRDRQMQESLLDHLRVGGQRFSIRAFAEGLLAITREFIESKKPAGIFIPRAI